MLFNSVFLWFFVKVLKISNTLRALERNTFYWIFFWLFHFSCFSIILIILFLLEIFIGWFLKIVLKQRRLISSHLLFAPHLVPNCGSDHLPLLVLFAVFLSPLPLRLLDCLLSANNEINDEKNIIQSR